MINIDWGIAPDWADGHGLISFQGFTEVWISADQYAVVGREGGPYPWGGGNGDTRHNHTRGQVEYITPRPERWNGEGLPPIRTVCEFKGDIAACASDPWRKGLHDGVECTVIAHFKSKGCDYVVFTFDAPDGNTEVEQSLPGALRPLRTAEQIAEQAHREAVDQLAADTDWILTREACEAVLAAGYRKQEATQ